MRLLPLERFAHVFEPLQGKRVGFVRPLGNVGDELITQATFQLMDAFGIAWTVLDPDVPPQNCDEVLFGGGGNMGLLYRNNWELRGRILRWGLPVTVLPQSFTTREDRPYHRVYVREWRSQVYCQHAIMAPDLALGLDYENRQAPRRGQGIFLRRDQESLHRRWFNRDPAKTCRAPEDYLKLAARHERIITDRLHMAISSLIVGRPTILIANSYHKNRGMYETWLMDLGCRFAESLDEARRMDRRGPSIRLRYAERRAA